MNKTAIKNFAIWARVQLIENAKQRAYEYEITEKGENRTDIDAVSGWILTPAEKKQRTQLIEQIHQKGYTQVMEEAAYTWFNRFIALRFMEVNGYLPSKVRVFTDENGVFKPNILKEALTVELDGLDRNRVLTYLDQQKNEELYKYLLITQCNALNSMLPVMFEKIDNWTELLFPANLLKEDSVIGQMVSAIPEEDWQDAVQIIGWMYQYYNSELKDETFALLKKNVKITKERIPAATQLFTPDWIVRYMVENSLGRLWYEGHQDFDKSEWKYYLDEAEQEPEVKEKLAAIRQEYAKLKPEDIKVIDPCMGSGHILVYAFDVLMQIYLSAGWSERDAAKSILENNLYGLDIDDRAAQLAYFAVMMKARQYDRRFFTRNVQPHVLAIQESNNINLSVLMMNDAEKKAAKLLVDAFHDAKEYGSILTVSDELMAAVAALPVDAFAWEGTFFAYEGELLTQLCLQTRALGQKYDTAITNPPYAAVSGLNENINKYVKKSYPEGKPDLFAVFIQRLQEMIKPNSYQAMITQHAWMSLGSYEDLRRWIYSKSIIVNMAHLGPRAFEDIGGEMVQTTSFVLQNRVVAHYNSEFVRLVDYTSEKEKEEAYCNANNHIIAKQDKFIAIPGAPVSAYVAGDILASIYERGKTISSIGEVRIGMGTGNNDLFLRNWWEVEREKEKFDITDVSEMDNYDYRYVPYSKGGERKRWYGNHEFVVWYDKVGRKKMSEVSGHRENGGYDYYFHKGMTWSYSTMAAFSARIMPEGFVFDVNGSSLFMPESYYAFTIAFLQSCVGRLIIDSTKSAFSIQAGTIRNLPVIGQTTPEIENCVSACISLSKEDWDADETSWDFQQHPLIHYSRGLWDTTNIECSLHPEYVPKQVFEMSPVERTFRMWEKECAEHFAQLKANEEELNRIFIEIYGLQDELTPEVADKDVTVRKADLGRDIRSLISYAVGCMFGRYSLDCEGLAYAGGEWDVSKYKTVIPDTDNIIPICDDEYFEDDMTGRFVKWVETVYGKETLEENLKFIADALGGKGTPCEVIRSYFLNDFYADHLKIYQKRPIYWLFDSGKKNGFKALIYMHRYQPDLLARMRTDYVHEQQERYRTQLQMLEDSAATASPSERVKLNKQITKLKDQALEIRQYEEKIHHLADQMIAIDLDDGVKVNYAKFEDVLSKIK